MGVAERLAVIEAGTRGVRLLVVERRPPPDGMAVLRSHGDLGLLGEGVDDNDGRMREENIERTLAHVRRYLDLALAYRPDRCHLVGTEVLRRATNVEEFRRRLPEPLALEVLTPEQEAVGSFLAASWGFRGLFPAGGRLTLIDVGGGSLEVVGGVQGSPPRPLAEVCLRGVGTVALTEVWGRGGDPAQADELLRRHIEAELDRHADDFAAFRAPEDVPALVAGLGSTVTDGVWAVHGRDRQRYSSDRVHGMEADTGRLEDLRRTLLDGPSRVSEHLPDPLGHQVGLAALLAVMRRLGAPSLRACGTGLRFGVAYALLHDLPLAVQGPPAAEPRDAGADR